MPFKTKSLYSRPFSPGSYTCKKNSLPKGHGILGRPGRARSGPYGNLRIRTARLFHRTGRLLKEMGFGDTARHHFEQALFIQPCFKGAALDLADLLIGEGRCLEAANRMKTLSAVYPGFGPAYLKKAEAFQRLGDVSRALAAYRRAAFLMPNAPFVYQKMGTMLSRAGRDKTAADQFERALGLAPDNPAIRHLWNAVTQNPTKRAPPAYVQQLYDRYAAFFENQMAGPLNYRLPSLLKKSLGPYASKNGRFHHLLDLGCGTGLAGFHLKDLSRHRTGVDISRKMLAKARAREVYDKLVLMDIGRFLTGATDFYDLVVAADVLIYFGELTDLLNRVETCLEKEGIFAFSFESTRQKGWRLRKSGRFAHCPDYVRQAAEKASLSLLSNEKTGIRMENGQWVNGRLFICTRRP